MGQFIIPCALLMIGSAAAQDEKADKAKLQGTWDVVRVVKRGSVLSDDRVAGMFLVIADGNMSMHFRQGKDDVRVFAFTTDAAKDPRQIDLTAEHAPLKGRLVAGIYRFDGENLILCLPDDANKERPKSFESLGGGAPSQTLMTLKRAAK